MQLHTPLFFYLLGAAMLGYLVFREGLRWLPLLVASLVFYAALGEPRLLVILILVAGTSFACGNALAAFRSGRRAILWAGLGLNLSAILLSRFPSWFAWLGPAAPTAASDASMVSIGVSFYVFQAVSYLVDVYRGVIPPERHPGHLCLYLCFFPKLLQGPIERGDHLLPQLRQFRPPDASDLRLGMLLIAWGLFKKIVIADRLAGFVDPVYDDVYGHSGLVLLVATVLFAFQLYADFSGYTDLALGSARLFGVRLTQNFNSPYGSTSIAEFWRRWHMTLSSWLRDYLFMPVTSWLSRRIASERLVLFESDYFIYACGTVITMLLCGLWHGAGWTFVVWGGLHGMYLVLSRATFRIRRAACKRLRIRRKSRIWRGVQTLFTFSLVCLAWVFFRAATLDDAWHVTTEIVGGGRFSLRSLESMGLGPAAGVRRAAELVIALVSLGIMAVVPGLARRVRFFQRSPWQRWTAYGAFVMWVVLFATVKGSTFLYARF